MLSTLLSPLLAQAQEAPDLFSLSLEELMGMEVTGSTLTSESISTVPAAVTVFNHKQMQNMGLDNLGELMNLVPGFQSYRSAASPIHYPFSSRGHRIGVNASEVLVLIDGQRLNESRTGGITNTAPAFPLNNIERVEFIRGPGAPIYGSNAMMGVVNIVTRSKANEVSLAYGDNRHGQAYLLSSHQAGEVELDLFAQVDVGDGHEYLVQDTFSSDQITTQDPFSTSDFNFKLKWRGTLLNVHHNRASAKDFYALNRLANDDNKYNSTLSFISLKQDFSWLAVESWGWLSYSRSTADQFVQITAPGALEDVSVPSSLEPAGGDTLFEDAETRLQWHNDWGINSSSSLQFGLELRYVDIPEGYAVNNFDLEDIVQGSEPIQYYGDEYATTPVQFASTRDIIGVYSQYQKTLFESSHITIGLRYDDYSDIGSQFSPRLAWVQEVGEHQSIKLLYGQAFRAPSENELNLINNPVVVGNPNLKPETVKSVDVMWLGSWSSASLSVGYFENHFANAIAQESVGSRFEYKNLNGDDHTSGYEFEASYECSQYFLLQGSYTRITGKLDESFREADSFGSITGDYHRGNWNVNLIGSYHGARSMEVGESKKPLKSYWQISSKVRYSFSEKWESFLQVKNLSDNLVLSPPSYPNGQDGTPSRGREFMVGIKMYW